MSKFIHNTLIFQSDKLNRGGQMNNGDILEEGHLEHAKAMPSLLMPSAVEDHLSIRPDMAIDQLQM